jgi:hypothetical protein
MSVRYFKATDGQRTYFRASPTRIYQSLSVDPTRPVIWGWTLHRHANGRYPAVEITREEYVRLCAIKNKDHTYTAPRHSFIDNATLEPVYAEPQPNDGPARLAALFPGLGNRKINDKP